MFPAPNVVDEYLDLRFKKDNTKMKHKYYDVIVAAAEGKAVQFRVDNHSDWRDYQGEEVFNLLSFSAEDAEYRVKPTIVKRWKWAYAFCDEGHLYESFTPLMTEQEFSNTYFHAFVLWKQKIEATEKEFTE